MRQVLMFASLLVLAAAARGATASATPPVAPVAEALIASYADATEPPRLETLMRLQLEAGRFAEAEATIDRLSAIYRRGLVERHHALVPWRVYARGRRYEAEGTARGEALRRAFAEVYGALRDREMARAYGWFGANAGRLAANLERTGAACRGQAADRCPPAAAAEMIAARQTVLAWAWLLPAAAPLLRAELERRFTVEDQLMIAMPDGAQVAAILVRPRGAAAGTLTSLLSFSIYANEAQALGEAVEMAGHGYAGMVAFSRGKGRSPGTPEPYVHDGADAAAVIDWLAAQGWSDGRVGMFSGSYAASSQWGALKHRPRALRAIATHASNAPGIDTPMQGQVFQSFIYPWPLYAADTPGLDEINYADQARWAALNRNYYASGRPYRELPLIDGHPNPIFATWLDHPAYDAWWQRFIPAGEEYAAIDVPVLTVTGYFDGGMVGALHYFREHLRHRPGADHRLLIGPYHHFAMGQGVSASVNGYTIDEVAQIDLRGVRLAWFDHVFRGAPLPELLSNRVNYEVMGTNAWRHVPTLDAMAPERRRLFLSGAREGEALMLAERAPTGAGPELVVDFADRSDVDFQPAADRLDTRGALVFATAPLGEAIEVDGAFRGRLEVVTNKRDFDLAVSFFEQRPDGTVFPLASYLGRVSYMRDRSRRQLLVPGRARLLEFESQTVTARRIAAGHRIVAVVGAPKQPEIQINYGTGRDVSDESIADAGEPLRVRFLAGSWLEVGVR